MCTCKGYKHEMRGGRDGCSKRDVTYFVIVMLECVASASVIMHTSVFILLEGYSQLYINHIHAEGGALK